MEKNHEKINAHVKKYNRTYLCYFLAYIVVISLALMLDAPTLLISMLILIIIHILIRCVDVAEMDVLTNEEKEEVEELNHFDFCDYIIFWDNFDSDLYLEVLKNRNHV